MDNNLYGFYFRPDRAYSQNDGHRNYVFIHGRWRQYTVMYSVAKGHMPKGNKAKRKSGKFLGYADRRNISNSKPWRRDKYTRIEFIQERFEPRYERIPFHRGY